MFSFDNLSIISGNLDVDGRYDRTGSNILRSPKDRRKIPISFLRVYIEELNFPSDFVPFNFFNQNIFYKSMHRYLFAGSFQSSKNMIKAS